MSDIRRLLIADDPSVPFTKRAKACPTASSFRMLIPKDAAEDTLLALAPEADAILCYKAELTSSVIRAARSLRFIQKHGLNCNNIDVATATERNVLVATIPLTRNASVAEHALAHMLACARKIIQGHHAVVKCTYKEMGLEPIKTSQWDFRKNWAGIEGVMELFRTAVGIIGMGDIGMEIAIRCRAFGMSVYYYDKIRHPSDVEIGLGIQYLPFDELLTVSDYVVLVVPHTPETEGLIGAKELGLMKSSAILINVGRGGLIDETALVSALQSKRLAMAGLDVYPTEPLPESSPLRELPNVVLTPHTGGGSYRFMDADIDASLQNIDRFFRGEKTSGIINAPQTS